MAFLNFEDRIKVLVRLGEFFRHKEYLTIHEEVKQQNSWFTHQSVDMALMSWGQALTSAKIMKWLTAYPKIKTTNEAKIIQVIMAGNLPLVGLHDLISVFISGHYLHAKLSSKDSILIPWIIDSLSEEFPDLRKHMAFSMHLSQSPQAIIASGSDLTINTLRNKYSLISGLFRGNRHSMAILSGQEDIKSLGKLAMDIKAYFGLGCRSVSFIFIPDTNILSHIRERLNQVPRPGTHTGYRNNLNQQRAILKLNNIPYIDGNEVLLTESKQLGSAMGVLHYYIYDSLTEVRSFIREHQNQIQCLVGQLSELEQIIPFGEAQYPELWDYADGEDTLLFLQNLRT